MSNQLQQILYCPICLNQLNQETSHHLDGVDTGGMMKMANLVCSSCSYQISHQKIFKYKQDEEAWILQTKGNLDFDKLQNVPEGQAPKHKCVECGKPLLSLVPLTKEDGQFQSVKFAEVFCKKSSYVCVSCHSLYRQSHWPESQKEEWSVLKGQKGEASETLVEDYEVVRLGK